MSTVSIKSAAGTLLKLLLAEDDQGAPQFRSGNQEFLQPSVQVGEPGYANFLPRIGGVYAQNDLSGGVGGKVQVPQTDADFNRYYYAEWADCSAGYAQKGAAITTLTSPSNSGPLTGGFVLGGTLYLVQGRIISSWGGTGSDVLTSVEDFGAANDRSGSAVFSKLGTESSIESQTTDDTDSAIDTADRRHAQRVRLDDTGVRFISSVKLKLLRTGSPTGDVRLTIQTDLNDAPSGVIVGSASILASTVPTTAGGTVMTFRFDTDTIIPAVYTDPFWLVLDAIGTSTGNTITWRFKGTASSYARGGLSVSTDRGNSYSAISGTEDFYFDIYAKTATTNVFVGASTASNQFYTSSDGTTYTVDPFSRGGRSFVTVGDRLVRDVSVFSAFAGLIQYSDDGTNWSDALVVGDPSVPITALYSLAGSLLVCKQDSVWIVDVTDTLDQVLLVGSNGSLTSNGVGGTVWKDTAFIPFEGRLVAINGDWDGGFTVYTDVSPSSLPGWDHPHGISRVVAVAGDRYFLYAVLAVSGSGHRLYKASQPLKQDDDKPAPNWHGSLATIGDGSQTVQSAVIYDAGGTNNPELFVTTTSNNIARIRLSRTPDPSSDSAYPYDTSTIGDVYLPDSTLGFSVHPKAWLFDSLTFAEQPPAGDYVDTLYHRRDAEGWKRTGRLRDTGSLLYPVGLESRLLGRRLRISNSASTASPLVSAVAVTGAVRPIDNEGPREITFTVQSEDGLSAASLGEQLGIRGGTQQRALYKTTRGGTRTLIGPRGEIYRSVLFLSTVDVLTRDGDADLIQVQAVQVG